MISIVKYGVGNLGSILSMLRYLGIPAELIETPGQVLKAERLILPGVGAFDRAMSRLNEAGLVSPLHEAVLDRRIPILGICLGMQLLGEGSEEGNLPGLGWIGGYSRRFAFDDNQDHLKIPHMGWASLSIPRPGVLFPDTDTQSRFYFVHSYHLCCSNPEDVAAEASHGVPFTAAVERERIFGAQFHPEKSHRFGMALLTRFSKV